MIWALLALGLACVVFVTLGLAKAAADDRYMDRLWLEARWAEELRKGEDT